MSIQWSLVIFTLLTGAGGCLFAFIGLNEIVHWSKKNTWTASIVALVLTIVGGLASVTHLSHPDRIMNALSHPTSGIFTEAALVGILCVCIVVYMVGIRRNVSGVVKVFGVTGGIVGILLSFMAGYSYIMEAQTAWATIMLPVGYLTTSLACGAGLWRVLLASDAENGEQKAILISTVCAALGFCGICAYALISGTIATQTAIVIVAIICEIIAFVLGFISRSKPQIAYSWTFVAAAVIASLLYRVLMWVSGGGIYGFF